MYELGSIIKQSNGCEIFRTVNSSGKLHICKPNPYKMKII